MRKFVPFLRSEGIDKSPLWAGICRSLASKFPEGISAILYLALVDTLRREIKTGGLAVVGLKPSLVALQRGQADVLLLAKEMDDLTTREELARLAEQIQCQVETVGQSDLLIRYGGVGCLLRYRLPDEHVPISA